MAPPVLLMIVAAAAAGAIVGSFLATLMVRWPAGRDLSGRSRCDGCGRPIGAAALVPLLSYAVQRGRCRACGARIDPRHPAIELGAAIIGALALAIAPGLAGAAGAVFGWLLLTLAILDLEHFWLPDRLTVALGTAGLAAGLVGVDPPLTTRLIGGLAGFGMLAGIASLYRRVRGREGLGQGDPKLLAAIGLWLGWPALPFVLLGASLTGLMAVAAVRLRGRRFGAADRLPLGTLMAVAAWAWWCIAASETVTIPQ